MEVRSAMRTPVIVDGRNMLDPQEVRAAGFAYEGIGHRSEVASIPATVPAHLQGLAGPRARDR